MFQLPGNEGKVGREADKVGGEVDKVGGEAVKVGGETDKGGRRGRQGGRRGGQGGQKDRQGKLCRSIQLCGLTFVLSLKIIRISLTYFYIRIHTRKYQKGEKKYNS